MKKQEVNLKYQQYVENYSQSGFALLIFWPQIALV